MKKNIFWDLDGTLTDPKQGIVRCIQYALKKFGLDAPADQELVSFIGPPLHESFEAFTNCTEAESWKMVEYYRERFSTVGLFENQIYVGITSILENLSRKKHYIATSKPRVFAEKIVSHFNMQNHFQKIYGSELNGDLSNKSELIKHILANEKISNDEAVMIGDRKHDILGAKKQAITAIGITWGYGSQEELETAGADYIFKTPAELENFLS